MYGLICDLLDLNDDLTCRIFHHRDLGLACDLHTCVLPSSLSFNIKNEMGPKNLLARPLLLHTEALHVRIEKLQYCVAPHQSASLYPCGICKLLQAALMTSEEADASVHCAHAAVAAVACERTDGHTFHQRCQVRSTTFNDDQLMRLSPPMMAKRKNMTG